MRAYYGKSLNIFEKIIKHNEKKEILGNVGVGGQKQDIVKIKIKKRWQNYY